MWSYNKDQFSSGVHVVPLTLNNIVNDHKALRVVLVNGLTILLADMG